MSTIDTPAKADRHAARDPQVYHPLDRLRGIVRRYVVVEGVLSVVLLVAAWFTLGLALDYGLFKVTGWDWVRDGAKWVRAIALAAALAAFAAILFFRIERRVRKDFSYPALALVLERKFPKVLGDRLITAVEMADVEAMGRFGYSQEMIRATIAEARERVGKVPVEEAFNWRRLWALGLLAAGLTAGTVAFAAASHAVAVGSVQPVRFAWKFAHVTGILAERNLALMDTPWPRRAHVELVGFPGGELNIGREVVPAIKARAYRWVVVDRSAPDGWRPLVWSDLTDDLVGRPVPDLPPALAAAVPDGTVDAVEQYVRDAEGVPPTEKVLAVRAVARREMGLSGIPFEELNEVFVALGERADDPSMGRTLRRLDLPEKVEYFYAGKRFTGDGRLAPGENNTFAGEITGLKEDVTFVVRGDDYETAPRRIRLIPPPTLRRLAREQAEPAYLHHTSPSDGGYDALENKLQAVAARDLPLSGDPKVRTVFAVPAGTELTIVGEAYRGDDGAIPDTDVIAAAHAIPVAGRFPGTHFDDDGKPTQKPVPLHVAADGSSFRVAFRNEPLKDAGGGDVVLPKPRLVGGDFASTATAAAFAAAKKHTDFRLTENVEFKVVFTNKFGIPATRGFLIQVTPDQPPQVDVAVDVVRKVNNVYLVTPKAKIPFHADSFVKDDRGLSKVDYVFTYWSEDTDVIRSFRTKYALRSLLDTPAPLSPAGVLMPFRHADNFRTLDKDDDRLTGNVSVYDYERQDAELKKGRVARAALEAALGTPRDAEAAPPAVTKVQLKDPERDYFDLEFLHKKELLKIAATGTDVQKVYRMDLVVQAADTNVDGDAGPRVARNAEPIRLRIVSESDLLVEISREEEVLATKLDDALARLAVAKKKFADTQSQYAALSSRYARARSNAQPAPDVMGQLDRELSTAKVLAMDAASNVEKARDVVVGVIREYRRLARECEINRLNASAQEHPKAVADALEALTREASAVSFPKALEQMTGVHAGMTRMAEAAGDRAKNPGNREPLPDAIPAVALTDAEQALLAAEAELKRIRRGLGEDIDKKKLTERVKSLQENQRRINQDIVALQRKWYEDVNSPDPKLGEVGVVSLGKNESRRLEHRIEWRQYDKDELAVKVTASDPSLAVTPDLKLNFEQNQFKFAHDIKAGSKEGTFKVTLTPAVGKPVEVQVIVK